MRNELRTLHNITGAQLQAFLAVAEFGGFSAASEILEVAQPTVSKTVRALESKTGPLFERRRGSSIRLNLAGEALQEMAPLMIQRLVALRRRLDTVRGQAVTLRACTGEFLYTHLQRAIEDFHRRQSLIRVQLIKSPSRLGALQMLKLGAVDAVFITHFIKPDDVPPEYYRGARLMLYDSADAVAADAKDRPFIMITSADWVQRGEFRPLSGPMPQSADDVIYVPTYPAVLQMCAEGVGRAYLFEEDTTTEVSRGAIRAIPSETIECYRAWHFLSEDSIVRKFVDAMLAFLP